MLAMVVPWSPGLRRSRAVHSKTEQGLLLEGWTVLPFAKLARLAMPAKCRHASWCVAPLDIGRGEVSARIGPGCPMTPPRGACCCGPVLRHTAGTWFPVGRRSKACGPLPSRSVWPPSCATEVVFAKPHMPDGTIVRGAVKPTLHSARPYGLVTSCLCIRHGGTSAHARTLIACGYVPDSICVSVLWSLSRGVSVRQLPGLTPRHAVYRLYHVQWIAASYLDIVLLQTLVSLL